MGLRKSLILLVALLFSVSLHAEDGAEATPSVAQAPLASGGEAAASAISHAQAVVLGVVEGLTEYLPVSSTGHLVATSDFLGLRDESRRSPAEIEAIEAYEIVIQTGAILAVLFLYVGRVRRMWAGLLGKDAEGLRLLIRIAVAFVPAMVLGLLLHKVIKQYLQFTGPVIAALIVGGVAMIAFEKSRWRQPADPAQAGLADLSIGSAFVIGLAQCLAMWPGTSRSMATIIAGRMRGLNAVAAAEFSFLLGLPTLVAASAYKFMKDGKVLLAHVAPGPLVLGLVVSAVFATLAVKGFVFFLNRRGLSAFGWYRIAFGLFLLAYLGTAA